MALPFVPPGATFTKTFADPSSERLVLNRLFLPFVTFAQFTDLSNEEGQHFLKLLNLTCRKLCSTWSHLDRFKKAQAAASLELQEAVKARPDVVHIDESQVLFSEFDEFVVQVKSTLDHLAHVPVPIFGPHVWSMHTFGAKGESLRKALKGSVSQQKYGAGVSVIIAHLFDDPNQRQWLDATIDARDRITHYQRGGIPTEAFAMHVDPAGRSHLPMWANSQTVEQFMDVVWQALVFYVEDFLALFLALRLRPGTVFVRKGAGPVGPHTPWLAMPTHIADRFAGAALRSPA